MIISIYIATPVTGLHLSREYGTKYPLSVWRGEAVWRDGTIETVTEIRSMPWPVEIDDWIQRRKFMLIMAADLVHRHQQSVLIHDSKTFMSIDPDGSVKSSLPAYGEKKKKT